MRAIFISGPAGAGKTSVSNFLKHNPEFKVLQVGEELRKLAMQYSEIQTYMDKGLPVPRKYLDMVKMNFFQKEEDEIIVIDGNLASQEQVDSRNQLIETYNLEYISILLTAPEDILVQRLKKRGRKDDANENIIKRIKSFSEEVIPRLEQQSNFKKNIIIDANQTPEKIYEDILGHINDKLKNQS